jgi:hypothetical protein
MASGIAPSPELVARFAGIQGMLQVKIADEELVEAAVEPAGFDSDEAAFAAAQGALVEEQRGGQPPAARRNVPRARPLVD